MKKAQILTALTAAMLCARLFTVQAVAYSPAVPDGGMLIYSQDFDDWGTTDWQNDPPVALGLRELTVAEDGVYSEGDTRFALRGGRLYFDNRDVSGDAYFTFDPLSDDYTDSAVYGRYTLQYELCYTAAEKPSGYAAVITEWGSRTQNQCYNMFALRVNGRGRHQCHFYGAWKNYSHYDPAADLDPNAPADGSAGTPLIQKLLGTETVAIDYDKKNFLNIPVTIRLQWDPEMGHHVYMKTAAMSDFVKVSEPNVQADGPMYIGWDSYGVGLKISGGTAGYIDNILFWCGMAAGPTAEKKHYRQYLIDSQRSWEEYLASMKQADQQKGK